MGSWLYYWPPWTFAILFGQINIYIEGALDSRSGRHRHLVRAMLSINDNPKTFVQTRVRRSLKPIITIMYFCNSPFFEIVRLWILKVEKKIIKTLESYLPRCSIHRTIIRLFSVAFVYQKVNEMSYTHRKNSIKIILDRNSFFKVIIKTLNDRKIRLIYKSDFKIFASP